jgi:hypothetical protein
MPQCNKDNMLKLVKALESGEYSQAPNYLRSGEGYCCLGVACDLAAGDVGGGWTEQLSPNNDIYYRFDSEGGYSSSYNLTSPVVDWLGLDYGAYGLYMLPLDDRGVMVGTMLNDGYDTSIVLGENVWHEPVPFTEIAKAIRDYYQL